MAVTATGFQGTVSDTTIANMWPADVSVVDDPGSLSVSAVAGARTARVGLGYATGHFVRVTVDATVDLPLSPPASGGKWYVVALRRQWSPTNSATLEAVDVGVTDTTGTAPASVPGGVYTSASLLKTPGTAAGSHQMLAAVYVRAADTVLQIFDLRLSGTRSGVPQALNLHALAGHNLAGSFRDGAVVSVAAHTMKSGGQHISSVWERMGGTQNGFMRLVGRMVVHDGGAAAGRTCRADLQDLATAPAFSPNIGLMSTDTEVFEQSQELTWYWHATLFRFVVKPSDRTRCAVTWENFSDIGMNRNDWTDVQFDSGFDPFAMRHTWDQWFTVPWDGRYRFDLRLAITNFYGGQRILLCIADPTKDLLWTGWPAPLADSPIELHGEYTFAAGGTFRARIYNDQGTYYNWIRRGGGMTALKPSLTITYLGPS